MFARLVFLRWGRAEGVRTTCRVRGVCVCRGKCNGATPPWAFHKRKRAPPEPGLLGTQVRYQGRRARAGAAPIDAIAFPSNLRKARERPRRRVLV